MFFLCSVRMDYGNIKKTVVENMRTASSTFLMKCTINCYQEISDNNLKELFSSHNGTLMSEVTQGVSVSVSTEHRCQTLH